MHGHAVDERARVVRIVVRQSVSRVTVNDIGRVQQLERAPASGKAVPAAGSCLSWAQRPGPLTTPA
ncbi:MAG: hypothetical protein ACXVES_11060 [Actinomycetota bacterium]